jgi:hypothetical protein
MDSGVERNETKFVQLNCVQGTAMAGLVASLGSALKGFVHGILICVPMPG